MSNESEVFSRDNDKAVSYLLSQFTLFANTPGVKGSRARLVFGERNGAPRITVFTGLESPKVIWMGFDPVTFEILLMKLEQVSKAKEQVADFIHNTEKSKTEPNSYPVRNTIHIGKNENGVVYLEVEERGLKILFELQAPVWHQFHRISDGQRMSEGEISSLRGIGLANMLKRVYGKWSARIQPNRNAGTGGSGSSGKSAGGYQNTKAAQASSFDETYDY